MLFDSVVEEVALHAFVVVVDVVVALVAYGVFVVAFVWRMTDLVWKSHPRHRNRTIPNLCRKGTVMGTVVRELLALELLYETPGSIHLRPITVIAVISQADATRTEIKYKNLLEQRVDNVLVFSEETFEKIRA